MEIEKQFVLILEGGIRCKRPDDLKEAAGCGWFKPEDGLDLLESLDVGQSCSDDDGDTWERIA